jgi:membrane associated rhomboid family serine protease
VAIARRLPIVVFVAALWVIEAVDQLSGSALQRNGIGPRSVDGLDGVLWAPLLHSGWRHVLSNSVPLVVLGWMSSLRGRRYWIELTVLIWLLGGLGVWLFAGGQNHIGASGLVFGYFGSLFGAAAKARRPAQLAPALVAVFLYGSLLAGLVPQEGISWEGHLFGLIVGAVVAYRLTDAPAPRVSDDEALYPWELDEPWRVDPSDDG